MSTLSGNASKGEKGKKFQQLKINLCTANKPSEPEQHQHKSSIQRKQHGMTALGKVPTARRPTNLPSEKSEHSGNDPSINLVPSGGAGWGNKQNETGATTSPSLAPNKNPPISAPVNNVPMPGTSQPVPHAQLYPPTSRMPPINQVGHVTVHHGHPDMKTWAMMTQGGDSSAPNFLAPQSPLFQHEFPSLSASSDTSSATTAIATASQKSPTSSAADTQYGPGPSLRPQTEGSWIQGGGRPQGPTVPTIGNSTVSAPAPARQMAPSYPPPTGPDGVRNNPAPSGVVVAPGGLYPVLPQYNAIMPPFMIKNPYPGGFTPNLQPPLKGVGARPPYGPYPPSGPHAQADRFGVNPLKRVYDDEDTKIRSIIKEEDLNQMANIGNDIGWAGHEDIDYNQKLKFSDDEDDDKNKDGRNKARSKTQASSKTNDRSSAKKDSDKENDLRSSKESLKEREKTFSTDVRGQEIKNAWMRRPPLIASAASRYQIPSARFDEDDETWQEKRRQKEEEMEIIMQRAKERKEEEEKRFEEQKQAAQIKLKQLEAIMFSNKENKGNYLNERDVDMLPEWEKDKIKAQNKVNENQATDRNQNAVPVPVVKDASEFRELTQLVDRSNFVKKDSKERENSQPAFSRGPSNNNSNSNNNNSNSSSNNNTVAPRFQNLNRQNSGGFSNSSSTSGPARSNSSQQSANSGKSGSPNFASRHNRLDSDSMSDKDRDWPQENVRNDRDNDKYLKDTVPNREDTYSRDEDRHYENNFRKEYESKRSHPSEKDEFTNDSYHRDGDRERETNYNGKVERKNSDSNREKAKTFDYHRYSENEMYEKESRWRQYEEMEKHGYQVGSPRSNRTFQENDNYDHRRSREDIREIKSYNAERERDQYRKTDSFTRDKSDHDRETERSQDSYVSDYKKELENEIKRDREYDNRREKEREKKSPSPFDDRPTRNELKDARFNRESRESLRDESYIIQEGRSYPWADDPEVDEKPKSRRDHYRDDRGDRYSHAQRHIPGPITRAKLEAKELESDTKRNLTALVRSDKKLEVKKSESDEVKEKDKSDKAGAKIEGTDSSSKVERQDNLATWKKDEKRDKDGESVVANHVIDHMHESNEISKKKDDEKNDTKSTSKSESAAEKNAEDKRNYRRKSERRNKSDPRNWTSYSMYRGGGSSFGGPREPKGRRPNRGSVPKVSRRDSKYSESDYSDEVSGSGREDKNPRMEREKSRPIKSSSKRYDRDDRGRDRDRDRDRDYRMDEHDYGSNRGRSNRDTYYSNSKPRSRGVYLGGAPTNKRMDGYGPPKSQYGSTSSHTEDKRPKPKDGILANDQNSVESKKLESVTAVKAGTRQNVVDRSWKKNYENAQEIKSTVSSPASTQTAEANEESFATASEGSDSDETAQQMSKNKSSISVTKRSTTVVVAKTQRKNFRSSSRKRSDGRRTSSYSHKDSGSYSGTKRNIPSTSNKVPALGKENDKGESVNTLEYSNANKDDARGSEKSSASYGDASGRKNIKPRNRSNSRKNVRPSGVVSSSRSKNSQDYPLRSREKPKNSDGKTSGEAKDFKSSVSVPFFKEVGPPIPAPPPTGNAWDKPLTGALRNASPSTQKLITSNSASGPTSGSNSNATSAVLEKNLIQLSEHNAESSLMSMDISSSNALPAEKVLENLDGASPPVQTIIFENTNFKSGPSDLSKSKYSSQLKNHRYEKDSKLDSFETNVANFGNVSSSSELPSNKHDPLQMTLFNKSEDVSDMKLDFTFDSEFSKLTEDNKAKSIELTHSMHMVASTDAELNFKIASVKKVWDGEHDVGMVNNSASFSPSFSNHSADPNNSCYGNTHLDNAGHVQVEDVTLGHSEVVFSNVSQMQAVNSAYGSSSNCQTVVIKNDATSSSSNVCKVKPQPQGSNMPQSAVISTTLSSQPPPMSSPSYNSFSCSTPQPNLSNNANAVAATALAQIGYQQYGNIPPVASPPVLYNSTQTGTAGPGAMYQAFQIDNTQAAGRSFSHFSSYGLNGLSQAAAFNHQQSLFLQTPTNAPPPELYSQSPYRLPHQAYGNTQQITSQNTVLISSSSNSLMSASIKPSNQQISVISGKAGYQGGQTSSPIHFMSVDPTAQVLSHNFLQGGQMLQRPASNVVPAPSLQQSTSFYSSASGTGQPGYFTPGTSSTLPAPAGPGPALQLPMFNAPSASQSLAPSLQNFNAQLTQQYRSTQTSYMPKSGNASNMTSDFGANKSMSMPNQHDVLNQAFQSNTQMTSNKQRMQSGSKNVPTGQQGVTQHPLSQNSYSYQPPNQMRNNGGANKGSSQYPHPIQRPVSQGNNSNRSGNNSSNNSASHRMPVRNNSHQLVNSIQQPQSSVYYSTSSGFNTTSSKLEASQLDAKNDSNPDSKLADSIKTINAKNSSTAADKNSSSNE